MVWTEKAEKAIGKVPFFVRGKVRREVEKEAKRLKAEVVLLSHVQSSRQKFLSGNSIDCKGFQIESCFGASGCENRVMESSTLVDRLEAMLSLRNIAGFLKERVTGPIKMHHELRICISECPNACSRPQIADIGIIGAQRPKIMDQFCTGCGACASSCKEDALRTEGDKIPFLETSRCVMCGKCAGVCTSGGIEQEAKGWRILVGGKLGRHPQLGRELDGIHSNEEILALVEKYLDLYFAHNKEGERLGVILNRIGIE